MRTCMSVWRFGVAAMLLLMLLGCSGSSSDPVPDAPVLAPAVTTAPQPATASVGQAVTFSVVAAGSAPLRYQWLREGLEIAGAIAAAHTLTAAETDGGVAFSVRVSNAAGSVTSSAARLTVNPLTALRISAQPQATQVAAGASASFSVAAEVTPAGTAVAYQWLRDGVEIAGATAATYTTPALNATDDGARFRVRVSAGGAAPLLSADAALSVVTAASAPAIRVQPASASVVAGGRVTLQVVAEGTGLVFEWLRNGTPLAGPQTSRLSLGPLTLAEDGDRYSVRVRNAAAVVESAVATLRVGRAAIALSAGGWQHAVAMGAQGQAWAWTGLPAGPTDTLYGGAGSPLPGTEIRLLVPAGVIALSLQSLAGLALMADGTVRAWGQDFNFGLLGQGTRYASLGFADPRPVLGVAGAVAVSAGVNTQYAVLGDGRVLRWGVRDVLDVANNSSSRFHDTVAVADPALTGVRRIEQSRNGRSAYALLQDGRVLAWGDNGRGQLGSGDTAGEGGTNGRFRPAPVPGLDRVVAIAATEFSAVAVRDDGSVWSWGDIWLGYGSAPGVRALSPQRVPGISDAVNVWAAPDGVLVLRRDGTLLAWGRTVQGERAGQGAIVNSFVPQPVLGVDNVVQAALGWGFAFALRGDGTLWTWGANSNQTGRYSSTPLEYVSPVQVLTPNLAP